MESIREFFHLEQYSEEIVEKVVGYKAKYETSRMSTQEIAEAVNIFTEDVDTILSATFQVWGH